MTNREIHDLLKEYTNLTEKEIIHQIRMGLDIYTNDAAGYDEYVEMMIAALYDINDTGDKELIDYGWKELPVVGNYKINYYDGAEVFEYD